VYVLTPGVENVNMRPVFLTCPKMALQISPLQAWREKGIYFGKHADYD
jgi:hypothetical protein